MTTTFMLISLLCFPVARHYDSGTAVRYRSWIYTLYVHTYPVSNIIDNFFSIDVDNFGK